MRCAVPRENLSHFCRSELNVPEHPTFRALARDFAVELEPSLPQPMLPELLLNFTLAAELQLRTQRAVHARGRALPRLTTEEAASEAFLRRPQLVVFVSGGGSDTRAAEGAAGAAGAAGANPELLSEEGVQLLLGTVVPDLLQLLLHCSTHSGPEASVANAIQELVQRVLKLSVRVARPGGASSISVLRFLNESHNERALLCLQALSLSFLLSAYELLRRQGQGSFWLDFSRDLNLDGSRAGRRQALERRWAPVLEAPGEPYQLPRDHQSHVPEDSLGVCRRLVESFSGALDSFKRRTPSLTRDVANLFLPALESMVEKIAVYKVMVRGVSPQDHQHVKKACDACVLSLMRDAR